VSLGRIRDARPCIRGDPHPGEPAAVPTVCRSRLVLSVGRASSSTFFGDSWPITGRPPVFAREGGDRRQASSARATPWRGRSCLCPPGVFSGWGGAGRPSGGRRRG